MVDDGVGVGMGAADAVVVGDAVASGFGLRVGRGLRLGRDDFDGFAATSERTAATSARPAAS